MLRKFHWNKWVQASAACVVLLFVISEERRPMLMLLNFGAFFGVFLAASAVVTAAMMLLKRKFSVLQSKSFSEVIGIALNFGFLSLLSLGVYFADFSTPRPIPWGNTYRYAYQPPQPGQGWETGGLAAAGLEPALFRHLVEEVVNYDDYRGIHSVLVAKNGKLVFEEYFYDQGPELPHPLRSANKSLTSALIGIAVDEGLIGSVDDSIYDYFPEFRQQPGWDTGKDAVKIRFLLSMTGGLDANDWDRQSPGHEDRIYGLKEDWSNYYLSLPLVNKPGSVYAYSTGGEMVLRDLLTRVSGVSLQEFARTRLFEPLGIKNVVWHRFAFGRDDLPVRCDLTSRDMLKFGQLYLNWGVWNGQRVISESWVSQSTAVHSRVPHARFGNPDYGFLWWKHPFQIGGRSIDTYMAQGNGGQIILVLPEQQAVIVFTQGNYNNWRQVNPFRLLRELILPAFGARMQVPPASSESSSSVESPPSAGQPH